jgi:hypothetical protein
MRERAGSTPHADVNAVLAMLTAGAREIAGDRLVALWLTGSLTYGDFDRGSSDIDYLAVLAEPLSDEQRPALVALHDEIASRWPVWAARIEGSWVLRDWLGRGEPPSEGRPYVNGGAFWKPDPRYGNEWLLNLYALRERGVALAGPEPATLIPPVVIAEVRRASARDLHKEWVPKMGDRDFFASSHHQAYVTLTLCRILHRAERDEVCSKRVAASWVTARHPEPWIVDLVGRAERWRHGEELDAADSVRRLIAFARDRIAE